MKLFTRTCYILLLLLLLTLSGLAQEVRVPFDEGGNINTYTSEMEGQIHLFPDINNLIKAELYKVSEDSYTLEILYSSAGEEVRQRRTLTEEEVAALRLEITTFLAQSKVELDVGDGRTTFLVGTSLLGLGYYGWAIPAALEIHNGGSATALYMVVSGASFYYPYLITENATVTPAMSRLALYGGTRGIAHGTLLAFALDEDPSLSETFLLGVAFSAGEMAAGYSIARNNHFSTGEVETIGLMGDMGLLWGWWGAVFSEMDGSSGTAFTLMTSAVGLAWGTDLAIKKNLSVGAVRTVQALTGLGSLIPVTIASAIYDDDMTSQQVTGSLILGSAAGMALGYRAVRDTHFSEGRGNLILLSTAMGTLTGAGLVYTVSPDGPSATPYLVGASVGGAIGYLAMYKTQLSLQGGRNNYSMHFDVNPMGMLAYKERDANRQRMLPPLASLSIRF